jgi:hypothetical protein
MEEVRLFLNRPTGGNDRKTFVKAIEDAKWNKQGFPDVLSARAATSVQDMFGVGTGDATGRVIGQIDYNAPTTKITEHRTYPVSIPRVAGTPLYRTSTEGGAFMDIPRGSAIARLSKTKTRCWKPRS